MENNTYEQRLHELKIYSTQRRKDRGLVHFVQNVALMELQICEFPNLRGSRLEELNYFVSVPSW